MKQVINSLNAPAAIGPYSHAVSCNGLLFVSGQLPVDPKSGVINSQDISEQTKQVFENIHAILTEAACGFNDVVKATVFLSDMNDFAVVNKIYESYFTDGNYPARVAVQVARLPKDAKVEIDVIASIK